MVPAAGEGYVAQEHPEGRITFVKFSDGKVRTLTGFELGAKVVDGSENRRDSPSVSFGFLALARLVDCGSDDSGGRSAESAPADPATAVARATSVRGGSSVELDASVDAAPPPEKELESSYRTPVATGKYVWSANPTSGRVALVDALASR